MGQVSKPNKVKKEEHMNPDENPIPTHDPRKTVKILAIAGTLLVVLIVGLLLNLKQPADKQPADLPIQKTAQVEITKDGFVPATLSIPAGTQVTWINKDTQPHHIASNPHPEHDGLAGLDSNDVIGIEGGTYEFTFDQPGEYTYHDHLNPITNGTIVVE